jgi:hypothetical protein
MDRAKELEGKGADMSVLATISKERLKPGDVAEPAFRTQSPRTLQATLVYATVE